MSNSIVNKITSIIYTETYITQKQKMDCSEVEKLEQAIEVHGYRGASKQKHNGVVNIKPSDTQLLKAVDKFKGLEKNFIKLKTEEKSETFYIDVKIVAHITNGNRGVGSLYKDKNGNLILYVLGFANYNYKLF